MRAQISLRVRGDNDDDNDDDDDDDDDCGGDDNDADVIVVVVDDDDDDDDDDDNDDDDFCISYLYQHYLTLKALITTTADDTLKQRIRPNYRTYPYKCTVKLFRSLQITASVHFVYFLKACAVGTRLNCIDLSMQFERVPTTCAFIKKIRQKKNRIMII